MGIFWSANSGSNDDLTWKVACILAGVSLLFGLLTKAGAALGVVLALVHASTHVSPNAGSVWPYGLLVLIHLVVLATGSGRSLGADQLFAEKLANWPRRRANLVRWASLLF
jgi:hypothetical protein